MIVRLISKMSLLELNYICNNKILISIYDTSFDVGKGQNRTSLQYGIVLDNEITNITHLTKEQGLQ